MPRSPDISLEIIHVVLLSFLTVSCLYCIQTQHYQGETDTQPKMASTLSAFLEACVYVQSGVLRKRTSVPELLVIQLLQGCSLPLLLKLQGC